MKKVKSELTFPVKGHIVGILGLQAYKLHHHYSTFMLLHENSQTINKPTNVAVFQQNFIYKNRLAKLRHRPQSADPLI